MFPGSWPRLWTDGWTRPTATAFWPVSTPWIRLRGTASAWTSRTAPAKSRNELVGELDAEVERLRADADGDEALHFFHDVKRFTLTAYFTSEAGLDALGHRTSYRAFEGCAPLAPHEMAPADRTPRSRRPGPPLDPLQSDEARR